MPVPTFKDYARSIGAGRYTVRVWKWQPGFREAYLEAGRLRERFLVTLARADRTRRGSALHWLHVHHRWPRGEEARALLESWPRGRPLGWDEWALLT